MSEEEVVDAVKEVTMSEEDEKEEVVEPKEPSIEAFTDEESSSGGMKEESMDEKMCEDEKKEVEEEGEKEEDNATMEEDDTNQITTEEVVKDENNDAEMNEENVNEENDKENENKGEKDAEIKTEETKEDDKIDNKNGANEEDIDGFVMIGDEEEEKEQDKETMDKENESRGEKDDEIKTEEAKEDDKIDVKDGANEEDNDGFEVIGDEEEEEEEEEKKKKKGEDGTETTNNNSQEQSRRYTVTAHSGCERTDPGSLTSIRVGIDKGAQIVEIDVRVRDDGVPVLAHDLKEKRRPGATTLEEALCCVSTNSDTVQVNIDLKEFDNMGAVYDVIQRVKMEDRVFFTGVSEGNLVRVMEGAPGIRLYVNVDTPGKTEKDDEALYDRLEKIPGVKYGEKRILLGINTHHKNITPKYIEFWHNHGYEVSVFTINSASLALKIYNCGADNITTKTPAVVIETLKSGVASSTCHVS